MANVIYAGRVSAYWTDIETMNYFIANKKTIPLGRKPTVAEVIKALQECPQNAPICNAAEGPLLSEIAIFTDGAEVSVELY